MVTELLRSTTVCSTVYCADTNALCSYATAQLRYSTYIFFALYCIFSKIKIKENVINGRVVLQSRVQVKVLSSERVRT